MKDAGRRPFCFASGDLRHFSFFCHLALSCKAPPAVIRSPGEFSDSHAVPRYEGLEAISGEKLEILATFGSTLVRLHPDAVASRAALDKIVVKKHQSSAMIFQRIHRGYG
ncbi:hypothetical protein [Chromobacterium amazonense]|uniref:hypothetical protein n=1 Tax=Chromobacterium amazonense TaxID=1382803 RepID=UPI001113A770|nr:hypothetical protein [Chromobacterium amazonense]